MNEREPSEYACWIRAAVERYEGPLLRYATGITRHAESARDVVQDAFLRLCQQRPEELDGRLAEWLYTVTRNRALDVRRKESRMKPLTVERVGACQDPASGPDRALDAGDEFDAVERLLAGLSDNQQEVLRLKFQCGLSYKEIAGITNLSVSNVGYLLHTALKQLRRELE